MALLSLRSSRRSHTAQAARELQERLGKQARRAGDYLRDTGRRAADRTQAMSRNAGSYVRRHPWASLGAAAGLGVLVWMFMRRR